jgi:hypothetical protein
VQDALHKPFAERRWTGIQLFMRRGLWHVQT